MKVSELIARLKKFDGDLEVHLSYPYGDRIRSTLSYEVDEVKEETVVWSEYHSSFKVPRPEWDATLEADETLNVVLLK